MSPIDWKIRTSYLAQMKLPATMGGDSSGVVEVVGPDVKDFKVGDEVYGQSSVLFGGSGSFAESTIAKAANVAAKPRKLDHTEAGGLPLVGVSALHALTEHLQLTAGQKALPDTRMGAGGRTRGRVARPAPKPAEKVLIRGGAGEGQSAPGPGGSNRIPRGHRCPPPPFPQDPSRLPRMVIALAVLAAVLATVIAALGAQAATFTVKTYGLGGTQIRIDGPLVLGDEQRFRAAANQLSGVVVVSLASHGGVIGEGIAIGRIVRQRGYMTLIGRAAYCISGCTLIWLSGRHAIVQRDAVLGFHAAATPDGTAHTAPRRPH